MKRKLGLASLLLALAVGCNNSGTAGQVSSLTLSGAAVGQKGRLRVNLVNPASGNQKVALAWSGTDLNAPPTSITIPSGALSAEVAYTAGAKTGGISVAGKLGDTTAQGSANVVQAFQVQYFAPANDPYYDEDAPQVSSGGTTTAEIILNATPPTDTQVSLSAAPAGLINLPTTVTIPAFATSATLLIAGVANGAAVVTLKTGSASYQSSVQVTESSDYLYTNSSAYVGGQFYVEPYLTSPADTDVVVTITSSNPAVLNPPATITVLAGTQWTEIYTPALSSGYTVLTANIRGKSFVQVVRVTSYGYFQYGDSFPSSTMEVGVVGYLYAESEGVLPAADASVAVKTTGIGVVDVALDTPWPAQVSEVEIPVTATGPGTTSFYVSVPNRGGSLVGPITVVDHAVPTSVTGTSLAKGVGGFIDVFMNAVVAKDTPIAITQTGPGAFTFSSSNCVVATGSTSCGLNMMPDTAGVVTVSATLGGTTVTYGPVTITP